jgi:hypothetical protein
MYLVSVLGTMSFVAMFSLVLFAVVAVFSVIIDWCECKRISVITKAFIIIATVSLLIVIFVPQKEDLIKIFGV